MAGQKPVLTAESVTAARTRVVREMFGVGTTYADISAGQKLSVDAAMNDAFMEVTNRAKWYAEVDPTISDLPTEWNELFSQTAVAKLKREMRSPQDYHAHWTVYIEPLMERIEQQYAANWIATNPLASDDVTIHTIRRAVIARLVRQRTPVFTQPRDIDIEIRDEFVRLWSGRWWQFRKRGPRKLTLKTDGSIVSAEADVVTALASREFTLQGVSGDANDGWRQAKVRWIDSTRATEAASQYDGVTGRPRFFYDTLVNGHRRVLLIPTPDVDYTAFAVFYIEPPPFDNGSGVDGLRQLPVQLRGHLRDRVVANLMSLSGKEDTDAARMLAKVARDYEMLAGQFDDGGPAQSSAAPHETMRYTRNLMSGPGNGNILQPMG